MIKTNIVASFTNLSGLICFFIAAFYMHSEMTAITALGLIGTKKLNDMVWSKANPPAPKVETDAKVQ